MATTSQLPLCFLPFRQAVTVERIKRGVENGWWASSDVGNRSSPRDIPGIHGRRTKTALCLARDPAHKLPRSLTDVPQSGILAADLPSFPLFFLRKGEGAEPDPLVARPCICKIQEEVVLGLVSLSSDGPPVDCGLPAGADRTRKLRGWLSAVQPSRSHPPAADYLVGLKPRLPLVPSPAPNTWGPGRAEM